MPSIEDFLRARLDEDEALAGDAENQLSGVWKCIERGNGALKVTDELGYSVIEGADIESAPYFTGPHIARHDPARVLAEVKAKRAILALHSPEDLEYVNADGDDRTGTVCATCDSLVGDWPCDTLKLLAAPHADHPDYKPVWKPTP